MRFVIIGNDGNIIPNSSIDAIDVNDARDMAMDIVPSGKFKDVAAVDSKEYQQAVQARGNAANVELEQTIKQKREKEMETAGGWSPIITPYTTRSQVAGDADKAKSEDERKVIAMGEASKDIWSLPGRVLTSVLPWGREIIGTDASGEPKRESYGSAVGRTAEDEGTNVGGSIARSPATAVAIPLSILAAPAVASVPFIEGALATGAVEGGLVGAGTSAFNYATDEDYTVADAVIETLLSAGIGSLIKGGSAKSIEKAKEMIKSSGDFSQNQIDYIYSKLGITRGGTTKNLEKSFPYEFDKLGDIEYSYRSKAPTDADNFPKVVRDILQADYEKGWQKGAEPAIDIGNVIPDETIYSYDRLIRNGIANRTINPEQAAKKFKILEEYKQWKQHLDQINTEMGDEPVDLNKIIKDAQYFYQKDPELGNIILDNIDAQYKMSYVKMMTDPELVTEGIELAPLADLKSKFLNLNTITQYTANPPVKVAPRPFRFGQPGSWVSQTAGRVVNTPESGKLVGNALDALRMPSIVSVQDVTAPEYLNLNQMRSK